MNYAYEIPNLQFTLVSATAIDNYKLISVDANGKAVVATASTPVVGACRGTVVDSEWAISVADGIVIVEAGGAVTAGAAVTSNATGQATAISDPTTELQCGIAITSATAAGDLFTIKI